MDEDTARPTGPTTGSATDPSAGAPGGPPTAPTGRGMQPMWDALRRSGVRRPVDDRWLGGVCSGTARRLGVDPVLIRVAVVALTLLGGVGVVAYAVALVLLPDHDGRIELERASYGDLTGTTVGAVALVLLAAVVPGPWDLWRGGALVGGGDLVGALVLGTLLLIGLALLPTLREALERGGPEAAPTTGPTGPQVRSTTPGYGPPPTPAAVVARPQRRGPGPAIASAATGTALAVAGGVWLAAELGRLEGRPWLLAACAALTVLGLALVGLGVAGRRDGSVGGAAFVVVLVTMAALLVPSWRTAQLAGDATWRPSTEAAAERGGAIGLGEGVLDLSSLADLPEGTVVEIPVRVGIGSLQVQVPEGMDVTVRAGVVVGSTTRDGTTASDQGGVGVDRTLLRATDPQVVVDARVLIGDVELVTLP